MQGWAKYHRQIINWEWYTDANTFRVFFHLVLIANHKDNKWRGIDVKRGQTITSYSKLGLALDLSVQQIRTALDKLEPNEITRKTTNKYTLINIVNYSIYQDKKSGDNTHSNTQDNNQITNEQQSNNNQITTNKNEENEDNEKNEKKDNTKKKIDYKTCNYTDLYTKIYDMYPSNGGKRQGMINFYNRLKEHSEDELINTIQAYKKNVKKEKIGKKYITKISNFFGEKAIFEDYLNEKKINETKVIPGKTIAYGQQEAYY